LVVGGEKQEEVGGDSQMAIITAVDELILRPFYTGALGGLAMLGSKYVAETGCPEEIAALARVIMAENALGNPYAHIRRKITIEDVLKSPMLIFPVRLLHMSPQSNGATALVLASEEKAKKITNKPVWIKDVVTVHHSGFIRYLSGLSPDPSSHEVAAKRLFQRNGITKPMEEIDIFEMYDPCIWEQIIWMEDFLFLKRGTAPKLIERGVTKRDGAFPISPSGGVVSANDIGATGLTRFAEAALQIRKDAGDHQVTKEVNLALVSGWGAANWTILGLLSKSIT
jgi:acetyl-CoA C-acetyltransferase